MKKLLVLLTVVLWIGFLISCGALSIPEPEELDPLFEKVLIIGASISADAAADSPGKLVAKRAYVPDSDILVRAAGGQPSQYHLYWIDNYMWEERPSIIFALDLFQHDFRESDIFNEYDMERIEHIIDLFCRSATAVYVGNIVNPYDMAAPVLANTFLSNLKETYNNLHIVNLRDYYANLFTEEGHNYVVNGEDLWITADDVLVDEFHPNYYGSMLVANLLISKIQEDYYVDYLDYYTVFDY